MLPRQLLYSTARPGCGRKSRDPGRASNVALFVAASGFGTRHGGYLDHAGDVDNGAVLPEAFELVEVALFLVEDVHHHVAEVEEDPAAASATFAPDGLPDAGLVQGVFDRVGDRLHVALDAAGENEERVGEAEVFSDLECNRCRGTELVGGTYRDREVGEKVPPRSGLRVQFSSL